MPGRGYGGRRGRRRQMRFIGVPAPYHLYGPPLPPKLSPPPVEVLPEEIEAMRLVDLLGLTQEEAAFEMGISKRAFWEDLKSGRRKVIQAIIEGRPIRILPVENTIRNPPSPLTFPPYTQKEVDKIDVGRGGGGRWEGKEEAEGVMRGGEKKGKGEGEEEK